jgi:ABC-type oligopeptide transport system substrate-binding subunit
MRDRSRIPTAQTNYVGTNDAQYASLELDALLDRYLVTIPAPDRTALLRQIVHHMAEHLPMLPLYYVVEPTMIANRLVKATARPNGTTQAWNAHQWDVL